MIVLTRQVESGIVVAVIRVESKKLYLRIEAVDFEVEVMFQRQFNAVLQRELADIWRRIGLAK
jgi:hypothetical protein